MGTPQLTEAAVEREIARALGVAMAVSIASAPIERRQLTAAESARWDDLEGTPRLDCWRRGRTALKRLLGRLGEDEDSASLRFPHARFSLTHSGDLAVAVGVPGASLRGVGVDLELGRSPAPAAARFFLTEVERRGLPDGEPAALLRLWTVKEALYKANAGNAGTWFTDYAVEDAGAPVGSASLGMRYCSLPVGSGFLTIAVCPGERHGRTH